MSGVVMVESERVIEGVASSRRRYYISSLSADAKTLLEASRSHWGIENSMHWVLDMGFREDESRARKGNSAENLSILRRMAMNLLRVGQKREGRHRSQAQESGLGRKVSAENPHSIRCDCPAGEGERE